MTSLVVLLLLNFIFKFCAQDVYDVIVYGATPSGIAAALTATDGGTYRVALIEPSNFIGGMSVAGGIGFRDVDPSWSFNLGGIGLKWALLNSQYYGVTYPVLQPDMYVGEANFLKMIKSQPGVTLFYNTELEDDTSVVKDGTNIVSITTVSNGTKQVWKASVFIDATYEGDLTRFAKATYTFGRENTKQYGESLAGVRPIEQFGNFLLSYPVNATYDNKTVIPYVSSDPLLPAGSADEKYQAYSYRLCVTRNKTNQYPFPKPDNYSSSSYLLLSRYITSLMSSGQYPSGPPLTVLVDILPYRDYPNKSKFDLCDSANSAVTSDAVNLNVGYVTATPAQRRVIAQRVRQYVAGYVYYLATDPSVPLDTRRSTNLYGLCRDEWVSEGHWPPQMYVREGLRLVGEKVLTQSDVVQAPCFNDSIAVGSWGIDIHVVQRMGVSSSSDVSALAHLIANNEGQIVSPTSKDAYEFPYTALLPRRAEVTNLIVPVCHSASHVAYGSTRVEPTFVQLGQAAGVAAAVALKSGVGVHNVPVTQVQQMIVALGGHIHISKCNKK